jgi:glucosyl-dolichyl phosphate glucuronosyltransferase
MSDQLKISVVIATYNRDPFIRKSLECLSDQTLDKHAYEIIVVDNQSTDKTAAICHQYMAEHPEVNIRYVLEANKGVSFARNRGIIESKSDIVAFVDDDAEAKLDYLQNILHFMEQNPGIAGIGGKVMPIYPNDQEPEWMNQYLKGFVGIMDFGATPTVFTKKMKYPIGCNMAYRKSILESAGGFNNTLTFRSDDKYLFYAIKKINPLIYFLPQATVLHNISAHRLSFHYFKTLFLKTGNEEKVRLFSERNTLGLVMKFLEYVFKFGASMVLYIGFVLQRKEIKGRYVVFSQWFTLKGFLQKKVFVR